MFVLVTERVTLFGSVCDPNTERVVCFIVCVNFLTFKREREYTIYNVLSDS